MLSGLEHFGRHILWGAADGCRAGALSEVVLGKAEICELDVAIDIEQYILGFLIPVDDIVGVEVLEAKEHFDEVELGCLFREGTMSVEMEEELPSRAELHEDV